MTFSAWELDSDGSLCFVEGDGPPRYADGTVIDPLCVKLYVVEADSWEEAMAEHYRRQGWEPYKAMDEEGDSLDAMVDRWHRGDGEGKSLAEYLGMTDEEYAQWVERRS